jgi:predicted enzyme related to lactoylglutathione lyase
MKRLHVHVAVEDIADAVPFYATLFGVEPSVRKPDYAKWMLDDPRVNFAISARGRAAGVDHLGIQVEGEEDLAIIAGRLTAAGGTVVREHQTTCCYARSDKAWVTDPAGVSWETFLTHGPATVYGEDLPLPSAQADRDALASACCVPGAATADVKPVSASAGACCGSASA